MMIGMGLGMVDRDIEVGKEYKVGTFTLNGVTYDRYVKMVDCGSIQQNVATNISEITNAVGWLYVNGIVNYKSTPTSLLMGWNMNFYLNDSSFCYIYANTEQITLKTHINAQSVFAILEYYR